MLRRLLIASLFLCLPAFAAAAEVPFTGNLFESGVPVNGPRLIQLTIYSTPFGGTPLHTQSEVLTVNTGVFHTVLNTPNSLWDGSDRWVAIFVEGGLQLNPRVKVGWVPYALYTPKTPPTLSSSFGASAFVSDQWAKVDSITVVAPAAGFSTICVAGFATQTINPACHLHYTISETTPLDFLTTLRSTAEATSPPMNVSINVATSAGTHKYYVWAKTAAVGAQYLVNVRHFSALYHQD